MKNSLFILMASSLLFITDAKAIQIGHPVSATARITQTNHISRAAVNGASLPQIKKVYLMNLNLTPQQKQKLFQHITAQPSKAVVKASATQPDASVDLGMNNVPVLDQGMHGTCVTFANTAAIDALIGKGDYVSQLCQLELGSYLETNSFFPSGWDGSFGPWVLNQMLQFGITSKGDQASGACSGVKDYPINSEVDTGTPMSLDSYKLKSESINDRFYWLPILDFTERFSGMQDPSYTFDGDKILQQVKTALTAAKNSKVYTSRLTFAVLLPVGHCYAGACAQHNKANDTWALTKAISTDTNAEFGGHEMVITGYDDTAFATDDEGVKHYGLLIIRNSWGADVGDGGTFYMTYDFFKQFVGEVQEIRMFN